MSSVVDVFKNLWFRDPRETPIYINETAVRIRAGILLMIPIYMAFTLYDAVFVSNWIVDGNTSVDTYEVDWDGNIIYQVEAIRRTFDWTVQTWVLFYGLFEMLAGMSKYLSRLSPTIWLSSFLALNKPAVWKPLVPKRFAWSIGAFFIAVCLVFFNPEVVARWLNALLGTAIPEHVNYMPYWIPLVLVWVCLGFMWMEAILGFCVGCKVHALLVWLGVFKEECEACNNIDWDEIARRKQAREQQNSPS
ncbi:MAG: DUF4395 domain-containing protein [Thiomicrospira sp.]|jgi:hypothetical protein|nr:DUF4395 domain-containing protein [Thiomicrospira sp.]